MATANYGNINSVNAQFATRLTSLMLAAKQAGYDLGVGSALRTREEQTAIYNDVMARYGSNTIPGHQAARPGHSRHESGLAVDLTGTTKAKAWAKANASRFGLHFGVRGEDWHIEPVEVWGKQPPEGYNPIDVAAVKAAVKAGQGPSTTGGTVATKKGNSRAERNNNPGNIRPGTAAAAAKWGATGVDSGGFAIFPTMDAGIAAGIKLLKTSNYQKGSIQDAISRWAPGSDGNNPGAYAATVAKKIGVPVGTPMKSLTDTQLHNLFSAMAAVESGNANLVNRAGSGSGEAARLGQGPATTPSFPTQRDQGPVPTGYIPQFSLPDLGLAQPEAPLPMPTKAALGQTNALNALLALGGQGQTGKVRVLFDPRTGKTVTRPIGG